MKVIALPEVREYLMELIQILYKKNHFAILRKITIPLM